MQHGDRCNLVRFRSRVTGSLRFHGRQSLFDVGGAVQREETQMEGRVRSQQEGASSSTAVVPAEAVAANGHRVNDEVAGGQPERDVDITALALGLLLEGASLATRNVGQAQPHDPQSPPTGASSPRAERTRSVLIGLLAEGRARARTRRAARRQARRRFIRQVSSMAEPFTHWFPVDAALAIADIFAGYGQENVERILNQLAAHGRIEEERARTLARQAFDVWVDEALAYFAQNPAVRDLITQQGEEMATGALDDLRSRSQSADTWVAQFARRVLQRSAPVATSPVVTSPVVTSPVATAPVPSPAPALPVNPGGGGA